MIGSPLIRILEKDNNRRGDLFGRLMADLFVALGYEQPRLNVHKSGRELDLLTKHRLEPRQAIAECKATAETIGGDDLNKFVGAIDAEHTEERSPTISGYFVSLGGFKETALEQEKKRQRTKIITLDGAQVVDELVKGRLLIPKEQATELAGRCCGECDDLVLDANAELLAHERGWIWSIYYTQGKERTHFALIHADGTPLARALADEIITSDRLCGGRLHLLVCLNPAPLVNSNLGARVEDAIAAYGRYLVEECGFIQLDGLPADSDVGSRRLRIENLFVPLHFDLVRNREKSERRSVGQTLAENFRLALLAAPGGGKSTLLKRLAVAYADSARRKQVADDLPERDWLPLFFRCRELRELARSSFADLLAALADREPIRQYATAFRAHVDRAFLAGRVLLLVDGLDEISDPGDRAAFVCTLRTALQAYPGTAIVVTSREAGFRHVAAHLAPVCVQAAISPFNEEDIRRLCVAWHQEVLGDTEKVRTDAEQLATDIVQNDRIQRLAINPLLLTTLLLVKRWVGTLPTRRAVLYGKAVEVLLMTWNTEGHEPIPEEEALPQLCYLASAMMLEGVQKISRPRLAMWLQQARDALPVELGYVKGTVEEFVHRVEDRCSLLMMSGHDVEDGRLVEFFEFRHLTFQEFLTARAMVEGWHPGRRDNDTLASVLEPHLKEEKWREVIPLSAVLGGKATEELIKLLIKKVAMLRDLSPIRGEDEPHFSALRSCLADEAAAKPETIRKAVSHLVRFGFACHDETYDKLLVQGRYGAEFCEQAERAYIASSPNYVNARYALLSAIWGRTVKAERLEEYLDATRQFAELLGSPQALKRCEGAVGFVGLCFKHRVDEMHPAWIANARFFPEARQHLIQMVFSNSSAEQHVALWALALCGNYLEEPPKSDPDMLGRFYAIWRQNSNPEASGMAAWALATQPLTSRDDIAFCASVPRDDFNAVIKSYDDLKEAHEDAEKTAVLRVAWHLRSPWDDKELARRARMLLLQHDRVSHDKAGDDASLEELLRKLIGRH